jgi:hypothetical protein
VRAPTAAPLPPNPPPHQVVTFEGRIACTPRAAGMRPELLAPQMVALSPDTLAAMDGPGGNSVRLFDTAQVGGAGLAAVGAAAAEVVATERPHLV